MVLVLIAAGSCGFQGPALVADAGRSMPPVTKDAPATPPPDARTQVDASALACIASYPEVSAAGHHYKVLANTSWQAAATGCGDMGHLVNIDDAVENTFVATLGTSSYRWIGLADVANNDVYVWTDGSPLTFSAFGGPPPQSPDNCVDASRAGGWEAYTCTMQHDAVCECE